MNKFILALAAVAGIAVADGRADWGTPPRPAPEASGGCADGSCTHRQFGLNPVLKKLLWWKKDDCGAGGCRGGNCAGMGAPAGPPPFTGGTLVFPNHQFARSPRDYFMYGHGGN